MALRVSSSGLAVVLWLAFAALTAGCNLTGDASGARRTGEPAALTYPYVTGDADVPPQVRALAEEVAANYVRITLHVRREPEEDGPRGTAIHTGSGVVLDREGHILTVAHIARGADFLPEVVFRDGRAVFGRVIAISPAQELALVKIEPQPELRPVRLGRPEDIREGALALAIGSPGRRWGVVTTGRITDADIGERLEYGNWGFDNAVEVAMKVEIGHSGGPVFNRDGALIGVVAGFELGPPGRNGPPPRIAYVVPIGNIRAWLAEHLPAVAENQAAIAD